MNIQSQPDSLHALPYALVDNSSSYHKATDVISGIEISSECTRRLSFISITDLKFLHTYIHT